LQGAKGQKMEESRSFYGLNEVLSGKIMEHIKIGKERIRVME
jgi:hypothetical protein